MSAPTRELTLDLNFDPAALERSGAAAKVELADVLAFEVADDLSAEVAGEYLRETLKKKDASAAMLRAATKPLNEHLKIVRGWFAPTIADLERVETLLKGKLSSYLAAKRAEATKALAAATAAVQRHDAPALTAALQVANAPTVKLEGFSTREVWRATVIAEDLLPREYLCPDVAKLNAVTRACPADRTPSPIPGVKFEKSSIETQRR